MMYLPVFFAHTASLFLKAGEIKMEFVSESRHNREGGSRGMGERKERGREAGDATEVDVVCSQSLQKLSQGLSFVF